MNTRRDDIAETLIDDAIARMAIRKAGKVAPSLAVAGVSFRSRVRVVADQPRDGG